MHRSFFLLSEFNVAPRRSCDSTDSSRFKPTKKRNLPCTRFDAQLKEGFYNMILSKGVLDGTSRY